MLKNKESQHKPTLSISKTNEVIATTIENRCNMIHVSIDFCLNQLHIGQHQYAVIVEIVDLAPFFTFPRKRTLGNHYKKMGF